MSSVPNVRRVTYAKPTRTDMAVLMVMFNPCSSVRIVQNWLYVWNRLVAAGIPVFGAELLFPWQRSGALADSFKTLTVRSGSIMFHKEKLLARLLREVPATFTKVCTLDCDIVFQRPDWYDAVSAALDESPVVHPFSRCFWLGPDLRTPVVTNSSAVLQLDAIRAQHASGKSDRLAGFPGFALAYRRDFAGFPWAVVGGGDAVHFRGVNGLVGEFANARMRTLMSGVWNEWTMTVGTKTMTAVSGDIWHLWHGPMSSRQYYDRYAAFVAAVPAAVRDIRELLVENADGVWEWREDVRSALNTMMLRYFGDRDDDAVA